MSKPTIDPTGSHPRKRGRGADEIFQMGRSGLKARLRLAELGGKKAINHERKSRRRIQGRIIQWTSYASERSGPGSNDVRLGGS